MNKQPKTIDLHCHYFPSDMPNWSEKFGGSQKFYWIDRNVKPSCGHCAMMMEGNKEFRSLADTRLWEPEAYIESQWKKGVGAMALSPTPQNFYYSADPEHTAQIARFQNEKIADLQNKYPGIFYGLGTVPLQDPDLACRELEYCIKTLKLKGIEIATSCRGKDLSEPEFFSFFQTAAELGACVFVHPWYMPSPERLQPAGGEQGKDGWGNWLIGMPHETSTAMFKLCIARLTEKLPDLRIGFAHGGGSFAYLIGRMKHGLSVRPEYFPESIDFDRFAKSVFYDSHVSGIEELKYLIEKVGADRIMAGSDFPYPLGVEDLPAFIKQLDDPLLEETILNTTPRAFLGLD